MNVVTRFIAAASRRLCQVLLPGCLVLAPPAAVAAPDAAALLTVLEGEASLIAGARAYVAARGARLAAGTIVETEAGTALLRLEWSDGSILDLGPSTRVMLRPPAAGAAPGSTAPLFYLLQGWAKQTQAGAGGGQLSAAFDVAPFKGAVVSQVDAASAVLFCESGDVRLNARRDAKPLALKVGEAAVLASDGSTQVTRRPPSPWLQQIPRSFRDTLAPQAARFKDAQPTLQPRAALNYAALQHWLRAEPALRKDFPRRFAALLGDSAFRNAVNAGLSQHPEWGASLRRLREAAASR